MTTWIVENSGIDSSTARRAEQNYHEQLNAGYERADQLFAFLLLLEWSVAVAFALLVSPYAWAGETRSIHLHVWAAIILGGVIVSLPVALTMLRPAAVITRHAVAIGQMLMSVLLIHLAGGRIEVHFHVFVSLAFLCFIATGRCWSRPRLWWPSTISCGGSSGPYRSSASRPRAGGAGLSTRPGLSSRISC